MRFTQNVLLLVGALFITGSATELPARWEELKDANTGKPFYRNTDTKKSQWERPWMYKMYNADHKDISCLGNAELTCDIMDSNELREYMGFVTIREKWPFTTPRCFYVEYDVDNAGLPPKGWTEDQKDGLTRYVNNDLEKFTYEIPPDTRWCIFQARDDGSYAKLAGLLNRHREKRDIVDKFDLESQEEEPEPAPQPSAAPPSPKPKSRPPPPPRANSARKLVTSPRRGVRRTKSASSLVRRTHMRCDPNREVPPPPPGRPSPRGRRKSQEK